MDRVLVMQDCEPFLWRRPCQAPQFHLTLNLLSTIQPTLFKKREIPNRPWVNGRSSVQLSVILVGGMVRLADLI